MFLEIANIIRVHHCTTQSNQLINNRKREGSYRAGGSTILDERVPELSSKRFIVIVGRGHDGERGLGQSERRRKLIEKLNDNTIYYKEEGKEKKSRIPPRG